MKKFRFLFTPAFMGVLLCILAIVLAVATFIENDFGSGSAKALVYHSHWLEVLFFLLIINLVGQIVTMQLYRRNKLTIMIFHLAFIVILTGAGITHYFGFDGSMHMREGESSSTIFSSDQYITLDITGTDGKQLYHDSKKFTVTPLKDDRYKKVINSNGGKIMLKYDGYLNNVKKKIVEVEGGKPMIAFLMTRDMVSTANVVLSEGQQADAEGLTIGFDSDAVLNVTIRDNKMWLSSKAGLKASKMGESIVRAVPSDSLTILEKGVLYSAGEHKLVVKDMTFSGAVTAEQVTKGEIPEEALKFTLSGPGFEKDIYLWAGKNDYNSVWKGRTGDLMVNLDYGSRSETVPFSISLNDFILERYPGSNSPSGYKSRVTLSDPTNSKTINYDIYMNHILKYMGYRFYQSSFDKDEKGTVLSVNHDRAGMYTTYSGYFLLFLFIILSLVNRKSFFRTVSSGHWRSRLRKTAVIIFILVAVSSGSAAYSQPLVINKADADAFGQVLAQDQKGRTKPLYTISNDILRKVAHETNYKGLSSMQVFLGYSLDFINWQTVPLIKVSNSELKGALGIKGDRAAFSDIVTFNTNNGYKLEPYVERAYSKPVTERTRLDKEAIKLNECVNIIYMIARGDFLKIFPMKNGTDQWGTSSDAALYAKNTEEASFITNIVQLWAKSVTAGTAEKGKADQCLESLIKYQKGNATYIIPSQGKVRTEIFYYKVQIFEKLFPAYSLLGLAMIITLVAGIISGRNTKSVLMKVLVGLLLAGFVFHTAGLVIRWYVSGHSPMSNGYESMLFLSWVIILAGFIFSRKSLFPLAATALLGGMTLLVAHMSFMDPEITNLVPVLKSYLLTLHVSVIISSYGFLGLGAITGLIVMILMIFTSEKNRLRISSTVDELTVINYQTLTLGLYLLTIGTFLGAVWANESWGRYWGWDPKETWSLITILVYAIVLHSRMIPGLRDTFIFNLFSLFAFSSVLMTYFGVNYYLSGLHSYAAGDKVPVPGFIYLAVFLLTVLSVLAFIRYRTMGEKNKRETI